MLLPLLLKLSLVIVESIKQGEWHIQNIFLKSSLAGIKPYCLWMTCIPHVVVCVCTCMCFHMCVCLFVCVYVCVCQSKFWELLPTVTSYTLCSLDRSCLYELFLLIEWFVYLVTYFLLLSELNSSSYLLRGGSITLLPRFASTWNLAVLTSPPHLACHCFLMYEHYLWITL